MQTYVLCPRGRGGDKDRGADDKNRRKVSVVRHGKWRRTPGRQGFPGGERFMGKYLRGGTKTGKQTRETGKPKGMGGDQHQGEGILKRNPFRRGQALGVKRKNP